MTKVCKQCLVLLGCAVLCGASAWMVMGASQWTKNVALAIMTFSGIVCVTMAFRAFVAAKKEKAGRAGQIVYGLLFLLLFALANFAILVVATADGDAFTGKITKVEPRSFGRYEVEMVSYPLQMPDENGIMREGLENRQNFWMRAEEMPAYDPDTEYVICVNGSELLPHWYTFDRMFVEEKAES